MKPKRYTKKSNMLLMGGGLCIVVLLLVSIITARVVFDTSLQVRSPQQNVIVIDSNF